MGGSILAEIWLRNAADMQLQRNPIKSGIKAVHYWFNGTPVFNYYIYIYI